MNVKSHINKFKNENRMISSIDAEKEFDKIQRDFIIKVLERIKLGRHYVNIIKSVCDKLTASIILNEEKCKGISLKSGIRQVIYKK